MNDRQPTGIDDDRRKLEGEAEEAEGPPVARMATTYGTAFADSEADARRLASDATDDGQAPDDGLGEAPPPGARGGGL